MPQYNFLGDIVIVEHIGTNVHCPTHLVLPEIHRKEMKPIKAKVIALGKLIMPRSHYLKKRRQRNCSNTVFACDYLKVGDTILVPEELGTRGRVPSNDKAIIYDSEDVIALIEDDSIGYSKEFLPKNPIVFKRESPKQLCDDLPPTY